MKKWITLICLCFSLYGTAQNLPLHKYEEIPAAVYETILDQIASYSSVVYQHPEGTYWGQISSDVQFYGYGTFKSGNHHQIGLFRKGKFIYGLTTNGENAIVGGDNHYAAYDLRNGELIYVFRNQEKELIDAQGMREYQFMALNYQNGDRYVGELYKGQRHGFGIYYYKNGNMWFGQYVNGQRKGFGVLFSPPTGMKIGHWEGEEEVRVIPVRNMKIKE